MTWGVVRTLSGNEMKAERFLRFAGFPAICLKVKAPRRPIQPAFRCYCFVDFDFRDAHAWHDVKNSVGVLEILGGEFPRSVSASLMQLYSNSFHEGVIEISELVDRIQSYVPGQLVEVFRGVLTGRGVVIWTTASFVSLDLLVADIIRRVTIPASNVRSLDIQQLNTRMDRREDYLMYRLQRAVRVSHFSDVVDSKLGCSIKFLVQYLEGQFRDGMTWGNWRSVWRLVHVIPLPEVGEVREELFKYSNLVPMLVSERVLAENVVRVFRGGV